MVYIRRTYYLKLFLSCCTSSLHGTALYRMLTNVILRTRSDRPNTQGAKILLLKRGDMTWHTKLLRSDNKKQLVDYVVLAEFDIDTGSTVRHQYPNNIPDYKADWFAEFMLPEGAHNRDLDFNYIFLNRDAPHVDQHLWSKFEKYGQKPDDTVEESESKTFLYGINLVKTRHDSSVRRGAIVKAMCLFSRFQFVDILKKPLELALDQYFDNPSVDVLASLYESLNAIDMAALPRPDTMEQVMMRRGVTYEGLADHHKSHIPTGWYHTLLGYFDRIEIPLRIPLFRTPDEVGEIQLSLLVKTFGEQVMRIFHAVLTKQRVLFVGYNHAASEVAQMVLSTVAMVAPPMSNLIRRTFPYSNLSDLSFLEMPGYIAGVTNPMFQQHDSWWDLLCVLDLPNNTGHIYSAEERRSQDSSKGGAGRMTPPPNHVTKGNNKHAVNYEDMPHYSVDNKFIKAVLSGINAQIGEDWVRQQFYDHTSSILHLALDQDQNILQHNHKLSAVQRKFAEQNAARVKLIRQSAEFVELASHPWVWCADKDSAEKEHLHSQVNSAANSTANSPAGSPLAPSTMHASMATAAALRAPAPQPSPPRKGLRGSKVAPAISPSSSDLTTELSAGATPEDNKEQEMVSIANPARNVKSIWLLLRSYVRKLQLESGLNAIDETQLYYQQLEQYLRSESSLQALLTLLPQSKGGLLPIATGLFHKSPLVRLHASRILQRIQQFPSTKAAYKSLEGYFHTAYERQHTKDLDGTLQNEILEYNRAARESSANGLNDDLAGGDDAPEVFEGMNPLDTLDAAAGSLSSMLQSAVGAMMNSEGSDEVYDTAFSETIDELDLLR